MKRFVVRIGNVEVVVLFDEIFGMFFKCFDSFVRLLVSVVIVLIIVVVGWVKCVWKFVFCDGVKGIVWDVCGNINVKDWKLYDISGEYNFVFRGVVVGVDCGDCYVLLILIYGFV